MQRYVWIVFVAIGVVANSSVHAGPTLPKTSLTKRILKLAIVSALSFAQRDNLAEADSNRSLRSRKQTPIAERGISHSGDVTPNSTKDSSEQGGSLPQAVASIDIGGPIEGLSPEELAYFESGKEGFSEIEDVPGGLGPRFNALGCGGCHSHPAIGGSSPAENRQVFAATREGATNTVPYFISKNGPVREVRFKYHPDGTRDGSVHNLFVITGRSDAPGCMIEQPDFNAEGAKNNLAFRIPTPVFGAGLIESIPDSVILANKNSDLPEKEALGISGHENRNAHDGTITRFGWKAQNPSLLVFAGEAYNVEQGVTNLLFPLERDETPGCILNPTPEDAISFSAASPTDAISDVIAFAQFMRFLAPPQPQPQNEATRNGADLFSKVGCVHCHTPSLKTGTSSIAAFNNQDVPLYSDLLVHHMGPNLADDIIQGSAGPDEFRTAPLWGVGQRLFYLHDGRTSDLREAILAHASKGDRCRNKLRAEKKSICDSEANRVVKNFEALPVSSQEDLLAFLRSL